MSNQTSKRVEMNPSQAKALAADLRSAAAELERFSDLVESSPSPDSYARVRIVSGLSTEQSIVSVRVRIGKDT